MTSSLVGSEMCIRDRHHGEGPNEGNFPRHSAFGHSLDAAHVQLVACAAVSYTHLTLPTICSV
eukprot:11042284-Prorocentrum_lima.AAC.1